jgi:cell division protein ZapA (FtsZ GTPase activity inhibitor)
MQIDPFFSPCTKLKSKWIKHLHIKPNTLNLIEKKVGKSLKHVGARENFLNRTPIAYMLSSINNKWDLIKLQSFCKAKQQQQQQQRKNKTKQNKTTVSRTKWQPTHWEKIFTN